MKDISTHARVVIVGGGVAGCSAAYHLTKLGIDDVVIVDKGQLTSGSTWHAAGMVGQLRTSANLTGLLGHSIDLYEKLEKDTGLATGWKQNGSLRLGCTPDRRIELLRQVTMARSFGMPVEVLGPKEIADLCPGMNVAGVDIGVYVPTDGTVNPSDLTLSMAKGARMRGCKIFEGTGVTGFQTKQGRVVGVETEKGIIGCETVVLAAGIWSRELAKTAGVTVPILPSHHQYMVTDKIEGLSQDMPSVRDPDNLTYFKPEVGGLVAGGYEFNPIAASNVPSQTDDEYKLFPEEMEHFEQFMPAMVERFPDLERVGIKQWYNGLEAFTEDTYFILGEAPETAGFFVACGFNAMGIAAGGGAGLAIAQWIIDGEPPFDLWPVDIRRFSSLHKSSTNVHDRALEGQGHHYAYHWPHFEPTANRPLRRSAVYENLKRNGACFGTKNGWERANWFADTSENAFDHYTFGRPKWFGNVAHEHLACRSSVALFDQSSFSKALVIGRDAEALLQRVCAGNIGKPVGRLTYTQALNERGGVECDFVVSRVGEDAFYVVTGTAMTTHDFAHIRRHIKPDENVSVIDVSSQYGVLGLMGPNARSLLSMIAESDVSNAAFPFGHVREMIVAGAPVRALRVTFVGELGWELHVPAEYMATVYERLHQVGEAYGLVDAGYKAIDSLRLEKNFVVWGAEVGPDYTPQEAGLMHSVALRKDTDFIGRDALMAAKELGLARRLVCFTLDDPDACLYGRETIYRGGNAVGWLTSGGFAHSFGKPVGLGYVGCRDGVTEDYLKNGEYELDVAGERFRATIHLEALYDPKGEKPRS